MKGVESNGRRFVNGPPAAFERELQTKCTVQQLDPTDGGKLGTLRTACICLQNGPHGTDGELHTRTHTHMHTHTHHFQSYF